MPTFAAETSEASNAADTGSSSPVSPAPAVAGGAQDSALKLKQQYLLLIVLLGFYCFPYYLMVAETFVQRYNGSGTVEGSVVDYIVEVAKNPAAYTNTLNQMIMPVLVAITAVNYRLIFRSSYSFILFLIPLLAILCCIFIYLIFNVPGGVAAANLAADDRNSVSQFLLNAQQNLAIYVMLLVGLNFTSNARSEGETK